MAFLKGHIFPPTDQILSRRAKALGHPARVQILKFIALKRGAYLFEMRRMVKLSRPAVSGHLRILREANLIEVEVQGRYNYYTLNKKQLNRFQKVLNQLIDTVLR